jgi:hypothetical protein
VLIKIIRYIRIHILTYTQITTRHVIDVIQAIALLGGIVPISIVNAPASTSALLNACGVSNDASTDFDAAAVFSAAAPDVMTSDACINSADALTAVLRTLTLLNTLMLVCDVLRYKVAVEKETKVTADKGVKND